MRKRRVLGYGFTILAGLLLLWTVVVWNEWLPRTTQAQQDALGLMRAPLEHASGDRNAWELFWLLPFDIPDDERASVLAADIAALDALHDNGGVDAPMSVAQDRYPRRAPNFGGSRKFCFGDEACLNEVRADPTAADESWQAGIELVQAGRRLGEYDHYVTPHRPSLAAPIPTLGTIQPALMLDVALMFVRGQRDEALNRHCLDTLAWRRLKGRSDSLLVEQVNAATLRRAAALYAAMRAELPREYSLPESCAQAFASPRASERQSCDVYRSEFRGVDATMRPEVLVQGHGEGEVFPLARAWFADLVINQRAGAARFAERFAEMCVTREQSAAEIDAARRTTAQACPGIERLFDPLGCILMSLSLPAHADHWKRDRDWEGSLHLLALAERLATAEDPAAAYEAETGLRRQFEQQTRFEDGRLAMKLFRPVRAQEAWWSIPLPGSAQASAAASTTEVAESD